MTKWLVIAAAIIGLLVGVWVIVSGREELPNPAPSQPPSVNPYPNGIAATGVVEAQSRNLDIAPPEAGLVTQVFAEVGEQVQQGAPLFELDARPLRAELLRAQADLKAAEAELARLRAMPRPEDIPPLEAAVAQARAEAANAADELKRIENLYEYQAANPRELAQARYLKQAADAALAVAEAELARMKAGAWQQQINIAQAQVAQTRAAIEGIQLRIDRLTVTSPIDGTVIKRYIEPGEFAAPGTGNPAMVLGNLATLHIRAQVNEEDAALLVAGAPGQARVRGPNDTLIPLRMLRIEPMAVPKRQLTGLPTELIDTRVIEVVFEVTDNTGVPLYPGQLVDVFIDTESDL